MYAKGFVAQDSFQYFKVFNEPNYCGYYNRNSISYTPDSAINLFKGGLRFDNFILDTCVYLGGVRTVYATCNSGFPLTLQARTAGTEYYWSNSDTLHYTTVYQPGYYASYVYDSTGCVTMDSVNVVVDSATTTGGRKTILLC
ncbi:MAG: hypothetical protein ACK574_05825, partial [Bacteroidota bacterium]